MKPIFPVIDNNTNHNNRTHKIKRLKLNRNDRLIEILSNFSKNNPTNLKSFKNNDFMSSIEGFSQRVKDKSIKEYTKISDDLMERYTYYNPKVDTDEDIFNYEKEMTKTKADYFLKTKKTMEHFLDKSKRMMKTMKDFLPQKAVIKFNSPELIIG